MTATLSHTESELHLPEWDVTDRLRKLLRDTGLTVQDMADHLGVTRNTVSRWVNGTHEPPKAALMQWARRCGVPYEWLRDGDASDWQSQQLRVMSEKLAGLEAVVRHQGLEPRTR